MVNAGKLKIYSASAGSGKTYNISKEYIKLLLTERDYHRRILAVTFTNKATEEMKLRIINELHQISTGKNDVFVRRLAQETGKSEQYIIDKSTEALSSVLHDYSHFSIATIDSFFQKVIRAFAHEMGLSATYNIELDQESILDNAIDRMINNLNEDSFMKNWLIDWAERKIKDGKSWNFKFDIHRVGSEIFTEELKLLDVETLKNITDKRRIAPFREKLENMMNGYRATLQEFGKEALSIMDAYALSPDDFSYKEKGIGGYFLKLAEGQYDTAGHYVLYAIDNPDKWYSKTSLRKPDIRQAYEDGLYNIALQAVNYQDQMQRTVNTARLVLKQLNVLGILSDLKDNVLEYTRDQNLFLISDASGFLKGIIDQSDTPFIYEKVGNFYQHFMIDEFQDTSAIQWGNFHPLISNSLSSGHPNWIVGDVKQSIYRWRNTDWKILSEQVETEVGNEYSTDIIEKKHLTENWRSSPEVIHFNNAFFRDAVQHICRAFAQDENAADVDHTVMSRLQTDVEKAYSDCYQSLPKERANVAAGYVHLRMFQEEKEGPTWKEQVLDQLPAYIEQLQDNGYQLRDIAILVRSNDDAQAIAASLIQYSQEHPNSCYRYDVLSNESLLIRHASSIRWLTAAMQFVIDPSDTINKAFLQYEYRHYLLNNVQITDLTTVPNVVLQQWRSLPVFELAEKLLQENGLYFESSQIPFIQAFKDILLQFTRREATDLQSFLDWWDTHKDKQFLTMPEGQDAIRLITIHKSKGLEFEAVLIPFCDWELAKSGKILWCRPTGVFLDHDAEKNVELLPLRFETELGKTIFTNEYMQEKMMSYIDNLNLLYVAFTRAKKSLFVFTGLPAEDSEASEKNKKDKFNTVSDLLRRIFYSPVAHQPSGKEYIRLSDYWQPGNRILETGDAQQTHHSDRNDKSSNFKPVFIRRTWEYVPHIVRNSDYFAPGSDTTAQMDKGRLLHDIFRRIITVDDLSQALNLMISEGKLPEREKTELEEKVWQMIGSPKVSRWFSKEVTVKTETDILLPNGAIVRPDRVVFDQNTVQVIDYKFGGTELPQHHQQVRQYLQQLRQMGYEQVEGFLWYVTLNKIVPL
ncbi:MAG: UvrD-helicase domain-containing protein [Bacteroidales bacterium]|jgi:ATP-dependent exoDNAse (exonuclease V) beta subunit|nr:UvrD-helicase domain-containing protein [Bacteroidales bacterium]